MNDDLNKTAFFMDEVTTGQGFVNYSHRLDLEVFLMYDKELDQDVGHICMNQFNGRAAHFHFTALKVTWGDDTEQHAREALYQIFDIYAFNIDTLIGIIPQSNRAANIFAYRVGFKHACTIPNYFGDIHGNMYLFTREDLQ